MTIPKNERWILLGASRGLGKAFWQLTLENSESPVILGISRKIQGEQTHRADFTVKEKWPELIDKMLHFEPSRIFYFAGGGPHGRFVDKEWKDHEWAFKLNFEFPAFLLHQSGRFQSLQQITFIGSRVAENSPDPLAASYAAGKHALRGLVSSFQMENESHKNSANSLDVRLFSPSYMDTSLLPANAWPRQQVDLVKDPRDVALQLLKNSLSFS